jgi:hypothetical protein
MTVNVPLGENLKAAPRIRRAIEISVGSKH